MNLLKTLAKVGGMTMFSRLLGFARDTIIARVFGAGVATDAFFVAFKLPNLLRRIFAEGAFAQAFVPILAEYRVRHDQATTRQLISHISALLTLVLVLTSALGMLAAPWIIYLTAPGFTNNSDQALLAADLLRITFPYIVWISLSSLAGSILNTFHRFTVPAFTPALLNISFIVFATLPASWFNPPIAALAWAVFFGGLIQLFFQLPFLAKAGFLIMPKFNLRDAAIHRILKNMAPAVLGVSVAQLSLVINTVFASFLVAGSVSWMYYADRLMELPTGVLGAALSTILLPILSKHAGLNQQQSFSALLDWGLKLALALALPAAVGLAVLSYPLIATLFIYGKFDVNDALMTQTALIAYAVGLCALILIKVLAPGFYARQNIKTPVKIAIVTLIATQMFNLLFIQSLQHAGLALAISLGAWINALWLLLAMRRQQIYTPTIAWVPFIAKIVASVTLMAAALLAVQHMVAFNWHEVGAWRVAQLLLLVALGVVVYATSLLLFGFRISDFKRHEH